MRRAAHLAVVVVLLTTLLVFVAMPSAHAAAKSWPHRIVAGFATPNGAGYWLVYADGTVVRRGKARMYGDATHIALVAPIVGGATTPSGKGYWLVGGDGGVFTFGDAKFYGSMGGTHLDQPVFSITPTKTGKGYWLVARDGGVFTFGDAHFYGSASPFEQRGDPVAGFAAAPTGDGYQMITRDALLLNFGSFPLPTILPGRGFDHEVDNVLGLAPTPTHRGEWIILANGGAFGFGDAHFLERPAHFNYNRPIETFISNPKREGYLLVTTSGATIPFGAAPG